jgi:hypothetical protein
LKGFILDSARCYTEYVDGESIFVERYLFVSSPVEVSAPEFAIVEARLGDGDDKQHYVQGAIVKLTLPKETTHAMKQVPKP